MCFYIDIKRLKFLKENLQLLGLTVQNSLRSFYFFIFAKSI